MLEVTDEMVKKAFNAWWDITDDMGDDEGKAQTGMRAALEAVAPMLIAQAEHRACAERDQDLRNCHATMKEYAAEIDRLRERLARK